MLAVIVKDAPFVHTELAFYLVAIPAVFLTGLSKGGFAGVGMVSTPLLVSVVQPMQAFAILLPILVVQDIYSVFTYRRQWDRRNLSLLIPGSLAGVAAGYGLAAYVSDTAIVLIVGVFTVGHALMTILRRKPMARVERGNGPLGVLSGFASGFASMIANAGSPPFQAYMMPQRLPPAVFVGTSVIFFAATNWVRLIFYALLGQLGHDNLLTSAVLMPAGIVSTWVGIWLIRRMSPARF